MLLSRDGNAEASTSRRRPTSTSSTNHPPSRALPAHHSDPDPDPDAYTPHSTSTPRLVTTLSVSPHRTFTPSFSSSTPGTVPSPTPFLLPSPAESSSSSSPASQSPAPPHPHFLSIHIPRKFHSMTAGAGAGLVSSIVTCPLDVIKTRLQAQHLARDSQDYEGVRLTILRIWRQSGVRGFYRGLGPTLGGYLPTWGIYFTVYDLVKDRLGGIARDSAHRQIDTTAVHIVAAMTAGATGTVLTNPLWVVKTRFMAQAVLPASASRYRNTPEAFLSIYRTEGLRAFYKGLLPSLIGVSHVAVQFPLYEKAKSWADRGQGGTGDHSSLSPGTILMCSAFSKMVASLATYPHEVLRTRLQIRRSPSSSPSPASPASNGGGPGSLAIRPTPSAPPPSVVTPIPLYSPLVTGSNPPLPFPNHSGSPAALGQSGPTKTPWQPRPGGVIDTFLKIKRQDGWRGFYRGLSINLVRTVPNSAVTMLTYELIMRHLSASS